MKIYLIMANYKFSDGTTEDNVVYAEKNYEQAILDVAGFNNKEDGKAMKSRYYIKEITLY